MRLSLLALVGAGLCLANPSAPRAQAPSGQPALTFRAEINYVDVDAIVVDQQGHFIKGLGKDDFEISEDGTPQEIATFSFMNLPVESRVERADRLVFAGRPLVNDVKTNQRALQGRLYVIVLDDLNTSLFRTDIVKRAARQFIEEHLDRNDVAAVVSTSGRADFHQDFTDQPSLLLAAVDKFVGRKLRSSTLDKIDTFFSPTEEAKREALSEEKSPSSDGSAAIANTGSERQVAGAKGDNPYGYPDPTGDYEDSERGLRAIGVLNALRDLADFMGTIHGRRKALLLFSEGIDYATNDMYSARYASVVLRAMQDAVTAAARGNVSFYGIDPRGLVGMSSDLMEMRTAGYAADPFTTMGNLSGFAAEMRLSQDSLQALSDETGGFALLNANDPAAFYDRVVGANSTYYMLGYYSPNHPRDGRFHRIDVRVKRPGAKVSARRGYADPRGKTPEENATDERQNQKMTRDARKGGADDTSADLRAMLNSPMQQAGLTMAVQAVPFKNTAKEASIAMAIEVDGSLFHFEPRSHDMWFGDRLELSYFSLNEQGKPGLGVRHEVELELRPGDSRRIQQLGLRMNPRIALAPGRYQLRIGLRERGAGALGTVFYDLEVPDFSKEALSMSGMLITAATSPLVPTVLADKLLRAELLPGPATSRRTFTEGDEVNLYVEVYDDVRTPNDVIAVTTRLVGEDGREVFASRDKLQAPAAGGSGPTTFGVSQRVSLKDVHAGRYLLQVEAQSPARDSKTVSRETVLAVVPAGSK
jgi:VWFA-related protein